MNAWATGRFESKKGVWSRRGLLAAALGCAASPWAMAQDGGVPLPREATERWPELTKALRLSGRTRLTIWGFRIYDAQLWVPPGFVRSKPTQSALLLDLTYLREFKGKEIAKRSIDEMKAQAPVDDADQTRWLAFMERTFPDIVPGDRFLAIHEPGKPTVFMLNGKERGQIRDDRFDQRFFDIWLGEKSTQRAMRDALLAGAS